MQIMIGGNSICTPIPADVNFQKPIETETSYTVPQKIHFIWIGSVIPEKYVNNIKAFAEHNVPVGYSIKLWVDHDTAPINNVEICNVSSTAADAPAYMTTWTLKNKDLYDSETNFGAKADILRYEIVYNEGGIYNDVDAICLRPFDASIFIKSFVSHTFDPWNNLCNAVFGFPAGSSFLKFVIDCIRNVSQYNYPEVPMRTGPTLFTKCFVSYADTQIQMINQDLLIYNRSPHSFTYHTNDANWLR